MSIETIDGTLFRKVFMGGVRWLAFHREMLNRLNVYPVPDGDTGTNMYLTLRGAVSSFRLAPDTTLGPLLAAVSRGALMGARGNSGIIMSQILSGFAKYFKGKSVLTIQDLAPAFRSAMERAYGAVTEPQEGTILTVVRLLAESLELHSFETKDLMEALEYIHSLSLRELKECSSLLPVLRENDIVDAGGLGFVFLLEGMLRAARYEDFRALQGNEDSPRLPAQPLGKSIQQRYCLEFIMMSEMDQEKIRRSLSGLGASLVVAAVGETVKIHIHTNEPEAVREFCRSAGEIMREKCDDMEEQHRSLLLEDVALLLPGGDMSPFPELVTAIAAIVTGEGLIDAFRSAGAYVIDGGDTMNPSVEEILNVLSRIPAENILLLPNNRNCIPACVHAAQLTGRNVQTLKTTTLVSGLLFMNDYDPALAPDVLARRFEENRKLHRDIEILQASRDSRIGDRSVCEGDFLALSDGVLLGSDREICPLLEKIGPSLEGMRHLTIIGGAGVSSVCPDPLSLFREKFDIEADYLYGGQPHHSILLGVHG